MITPMQMYWLLKLDDIITGCALMCGVLVGCVLLSALTFCYAKDVENKKVGNYASIAFLLFVMGLIFFSAVTVFLPSTKQMAAIYVVPAIANNEKVQNISNKTLDISNQLLDLTKEYLKDKAKNK